MKLPALRLKLELALEHYGVLACVLVALALIEAVACAWLLYDARRDLHAAQAGLATADATLKRTPKVPAREPKRVDAIDAFEQLLTPSDAIPSLLTQSWTMAADQRVFVSRAEYKFEPDAPGGFTRMHIQVPAVGAYPAIKRYVFEQLRTHPAMALNKLVIKRDRTNTGDVAAELHFVVMVEGTIR
jgi:hypothetical protein